MQTLHDLAWFDSQSPGVMRHQLPLLGPAAKQMDHASILQGSGNGKTDPRAAGPGCQDWHWLPSLLLRRSVCQIQSFILWFSCKNKSRSHNELHPWTEHMTPRAFHWCTAQAQVTNSFGWICGQNQWLIQICFFDAPTQNKFSDNNMWENKLFTATFLSNNSARHY